MIYGFLAVGQEGKNQRSNSDIFFSRQIRDAKTKDRYTHIGIRTFLKDTMISQKSFKKYQKKVYARNTKENSFLTYYESFDKHCYEKRDAKLQVIHHIDLHTVKDQQGILFGEKATVAMNFDTTETRRNTKIIRYKSSPRIFFQKNQPDKYIRMRPDLDILEVETSSSIQTTHMLAPLFSNLTEGINNTTPVTYNIDINMGDEIQVVYKKAISNPNTGKIKYQNSKLVTARYIRDSIVQDAKTIYLETEQYSYVTEQSRKTIVPVTITPDGYNYNGRFYSSTEYAPEIKITDSPKPHIFCQGHVMDTIGNTVFPRIVTYSSASPWGQYQLLPYFPVVLFSNTQHDVEITYIKKKGKEFGKKRKPENIHPNITSSNDPSFREYSTDQDIAYVESFDLLPDSECQITYSLTVSGKVQWLLYPKNQKKPIELLSEQKAPGIHIQSFPFDTSTHEQGFEIEMIFYWKDGIISKRMNF